jgi:hypothetical protein
MRVSTSKSQRMGPSVDRKSTPRMKLQQPKLMLTQSMEKCSSPMRYGNLPSHALASKVVPVGDDDAELLGFRQLQC